MRDRSVVEELHGDGVSSSNISDFSLCSIAERSQIAAKVVATGCQIVECRGEFCGHIALVPSCLTDVLPVLRYFIVQNKLAENVVRRNGLSQYSGDRNEGSKMLHLDKDQQRLNTTGNIDECGLLRGFKPKKWEDKIVEELVQDRRVFEYLYSFRRGLYAHISLPFKQRHAKTTP